MNRALKEPIERAKTGRSGPKAEFVAIAEEIEDGLAGDDQASDEDLRAVDEGRAAGRRDRR